MASGYVKGSRRSSGKRYFKDEDFQEEEVWGFMEDLGGSSVLKQRNPKTFSSSSSSSRHLVSTPRMIPRKEIINNPSKEHSKRSSAPVSIPNRQIMLHGNGTPSWVVNECYGNGNGNGYDHDDGADEDDDDDDGDDEIVPPHEYIARRLARTQISSFSVCEGVGRKLKGRDLSEVRNDVLRKTGFLER